MEPKQVLEAAEEAERLHGEMFPQEVKEEAAPVADNKPEPVIDNNEPEQTPDEDLEELKKFKARYQTLKGKYEAEVPRLQTELKDLKQSVFERLESIQKVNNNDPEPKENELFASFKEEYGDKFYDTLIEMVKLASKEEIKTSIKPVEDKITSVEENQYEEAKKGFVQFLDSKVEGDWRTLWNGEDEDFIEFAQSPDPSGLYTYGQLIDLYNQNWEGEKLAKIFNNYLSSKNPVVPEPVIPEQKLPNKQKEALVAPSRNTNNQPPKPDDKRIWTPQMIKEFETADRQGKYDPETSKAMWDDLLSAVGENRIR